MKKILAILALIVLMSTCPLAYALDLQGPPSLHHASPGGEQQMQSGGTDVPDGDDEDQSGTDGDPHNLGGGFRGVDEPVGNNLPIWVGPYMALIFILV